jgi:hypothetical protein
MLENDQETISRVEYSLENEALNFKLNAIFNEYRKYSASCL